MLIDIFAKNNKGQTAIHKAAKHDEIITMYFFYTKGLDINEKDNEGKTPLHLAACEGNVVTTHIMSWGGKLDNKDNEGNTPLHVAILCKAE